MIDLDKLAENKAKKVGQDEAVWQKMVWTNEFQQLSQAISDGEIELFFESCRTVLHFEIMTKYLSESVFSSGISFSEMLDKVARSGYQLIDWVDSIVEINRWAKTQQKMLTFFEILMYINSCAIKSGETASPLLEAIQAELKSNPPGPK